ncbi:MAG: transposase [Patescibacteria group bacterium]
MRQIRIAPGEIYHLYNRGVNKQNIFHDRSDFYRFLFLIIAFQSPINFLHVGRMAKAFGQHRVSAIDAEDLVKIIKKRFVELTAYCLMPNHFHLVVKEIDDKGIARYMQRVLNSYTKYYNTKYQKSGHVFQGPYQAVHIVDDKQLLYLSAYVHKNPEKWSDYSWSSFEDYMNKNRWGSLLKPEIILEQFKSKDQYGRFVSSSTAKEVIEEIGQHSVLDKD